MLGKLKRDLTHLSAMVWAPMRRKIMISYGNTYQYVFIPFLTYNKGKTLNFDYEVYRCYNIYLRKEKKKIAAPKCALNFLMKL